MGSFYCLLHKRSCENILFIPECFNPFCRFSLNSGFAEVLFNSKIASSAKNLWSMSLEILEARNSPMSPNSTRSVPNDILYYFIYYNPPITTSEILWVTLREHVPILLLCTSHMPPHTAKIRCYAPRNVHEMFNVAFTAWHLDPDYGVVFQAWQNKRSVRNAFGNIPHETARFLHWKEACWVGGNTEEETPSCWNSRR